LGADGTADFGKGIGRLDETAGVLIQTDGSALRRWASVGLDAADASKEWDAAAVGGT